MKRIALLGSTGSIGTQTLDVVRAFPHLLSITALAAYGRQKDLLFQQILEFSPSFVVVYDANTYQTVREAFPRVSVLFGEEGLVTIASSDEVDTLVAASSGIDAVPAILAAIEAKKEIALANKEALVACGELLCRKAKEHHVSFLPVDSEHNALYQCLSSLDGRHVKKLFLTASGGPLWRKTVDELQKVTKQEVLRHPIWHMGTKITVDSSTLVNKGLEMIEAYWLFDLPHAEIDAVIHPQSLVHGMVELCDHTVFSVMNPPSMLFPIQHVLTTPERQPSLLKGLDFSIQQTLEFFPIDEERFPSLRLAKRVIQEQGSSGSFFNAANETLVERFLADEISWCDILVKLSQLMDGHKTYPCNSLEDILAVAREAKALAHEI